MNVAVEEEVRSTLKLIIFDATHKLFVLLVPAYKACADRKLELKINIEEHASNTATILLSSNDAATLFVSLKLNYVKTNASKEYQDHHNLALPSAFISSLTDDVLLILEKLWIHWKISSTK